MLNLVLVSGGYDSTVLSRFILKNKDNVVLYHCNFIDCNTSSQYYSFSILNREETLKFLNNKPENVDVLFSKISALKELDYDNIDGKIVRSSYIPSRNSMLVLDAVNKVYGKYPKDTKITIYLGLIKTNPQFPDGTIDWLNSINKLLEVEFGDRVHVECPFIDLDKDDVYKIGCELHVDLNTTFSCNYAINGKECGKCGNCLWRKKHTYPSYGRKV